MAHDHFDPRTELLDVAGGPRLYDPWSAREFSLHSVYQRVTQGLANIDVRVIGRGEPVLLRPVTGSSIQIEGGVAGVLNENERIAAAYYQRLGLNVVRLSHDLPAIPTCVTRSPELHEYCDHLKREMGEELYYGYTFVPPACRGAIALNGVESKYFSMQCCPPDLFVYDPTEPDRRMFVEVKGPSDKLRFGQANWFVKILPAAFRMEICAVTRPGSDRRFLLAARSGARDTTKFNDAYAWELRGLEVFRKKRRNRRRPDQLDFSRYYTPGSERADSAGERFWSVHAPWRLQFPEEA